MIPPGAISLTLGDAVVAWILVARARGVDLSPELQAIIHEHGTDAAAGVLVRGIEEATIAALRYAIDNRPADEPTA